MFQTPSLGSAQNLRASFSYLQTNRVRYTYSVRNLLIISTSTNGVSWTNPLNQLNYRESRESPNPLNRLDYNDSLELANPLIIPKTCNAEHRNKHEQYSASGQNDVKRGLEVSANNVGSCGDDCFLYHEKNQHIAVLHDGTE